MTAENIRATLTIVGRVQGVFFRESTRREAEALGVTGWVRNERDGSVRALIEGPRAKVEALVAWCAHGPPSARVENVERQDAAATGEFTEFQVAYGGAR